jgi:hypothetical protein
MNPGATASAILIVIWAGLALISCPAHAVEISKADQIATLKHISELAREQKAELCKAAWDLKQAEKSVADLQQENALLKEKSRQALKKFLELYIVIGGLLAWIFRGPIISAVKGLIVFARPI